MRTYEEAVTISFADADPAGVAFYPRAIALAHGVVENLIMHSGIGWHAWFASPDQAAPLRHAEADFLLPMRAGETFTARAAVEKIGDTSVTFVVAFVNAADETAARIRTVHVTIDKATGKPIRITESIRAALA
jgi:4-hydroxybenzoyl-CoA thioesterase